MSEVTSPLPKVDRPPDQAAGRFELTTSRQFTGWLAASGASIAITTYQSGKVILIGSNEATGRLSIFERTLDRPKSSSVQAVTPYPKGERGVRIELKPESS